MFDPFFPEFTHPTAKALYANILDNPDDDAPRLIYADWLEEHGGAQAADRADFIRLDIRLTALENMKQGNSDEGRHLARRLYVLSTRYTNQWANPVLDIGSAPIWLMGKPFEPGDERIQPLSEDQIPLRRRSSWGAAYVIRLKQAAGSLAALFRRDRRAEYEEEFDNEWEQRRGFLGHLRTTLDYFLDRGEALFSRVPLTELELVVTHLTDGHLQALAACPYLARLRVLSVGGEAFGDAAAIALAQSPHVANLTQLYLSCTSVAAAGAHAVAASPFFQKLRGLTLPGRSYLDSAACRQQLQRRFNKGYSPCLFGLYFENEESLPSGATA